MNTHADCQRCGKFGGTVVSLIQDGGMTSRFICPYCLDQEEKLRTVLLDASNEALNALIGCAIPGRGCDDREHLLNAQASLRAAISRAEERTE